MGKKNKCISTPLGRKSKDRGGKEIKGRATIYTPAVSLLVFWSFSRLVFWSYGLNNRTRL